MFSATLTLGFADAGFQMRTLSGTGYKESTLTVVTAGSGSVLVNDAGTCSSSCMYTVRDGVTQTLVAQPASGNGIQSWTGATCTGPICTFAESGPTTVLATFARLNLVFVTAHFLPSTFGGRVNADNACYYAKIDGGFPGNFRALLADNSGSEVTDLRASTARGFARPDGLPVADTLNDLLSGKFLYPPSLDQQRKLSNLFFWSGLKADAGTATTNCTNWTSGTLAADVTVGNAGAGGDSFLSASVQSAYCGTTAAVFCVESSQTAQVVTAPPPQGSKLAFVSDGKFPGSVGPVAANALCQSEATTAGLSGSFVALRSSVQDAGVSLLAPDAGPIYRVDGVRWIAGTAALRGFSPSPDSALNLKTDGGYLLDLVDATVWTGGLPATASSEGSVITADDCMAWSTAAGTSNGGTGVAIVALGVAVVLFILGGSR
jgi:hypothetical protein